MRPALVCAALLGCQSSTPGVPSVPPAMVQSVASGTVSGSSVSVPVAPLAGGDLVVVAVANTGGPFTEREVTDNAGDLSHPLWFSNAACGPRFATIDVWTIAAASAGSTAITVQMKAPDTFEVLAFEVAGMSAGPLPVDTSSDAQGSQTIAAAPALDVSAGQLVVSTLATCGTIESIIGGSAFTTLDAQNGTAVAYLIAPSDGTYGAAWDYTGSSWTAHTDSFALP